MIEPPSAVHFGANHGDSPVRILLATLFKTGRPPSIPVTDDASGCPNVASGSLVAHDFKAQKACGKAARREG